MTMRLIVPCAALESTFAASAWVAAAEAFAALAVSPGASGRIGSVISGSDFKEFASAVKFLARVSESRGPVFAYEVTVLADASLRVVAPDDVSRFELAIDPPAWRSITIRSGSESMNVE